MLSRRSVFAAVLLAGMALTAPVGAQKPALCMIVGEVHDPSNAPLAGVSVEAVSDIQDDEPHAVYTDEDGKFELADLPSGTYAVTFSFPRYQTLRHEGISLAPGKVYSTSVALEPGATRD